jgi:hypothetical protein
MTDFVVGAANILLGIFLHALITGRMSRTGAGLEYWSKWQAQHPIFSRYGPAFLVAFGLFRIGFGLLP